MVLSALPGVGDRLAKKITDHFGDEQAALDSLRCGDIARVAEIDGVSPKRALSLARLVAGDSQSFLATKEAEKLHKEILEHIQNYASAPATRQRMQLLMPVEDPSQRRQKSIDAMTFAAKHPQRMNQIATILKGLGQTHYSGERYERVVVSKKPMDSLKKWCRVLQPGEGETWKDYTVFKQVTWIGAGAPADTPEGWVVLGANPMPEMILPERTISWFKNNQRTLSTLVAIVEDAHLGDEGDAFLHEVHAAVTELGRLPEWLNSIDEQGDLELIADVKDRLWNIVKGLESEVNQEVTKAMDSAKMNLTGSELLEALSDGAAFQRKLQNATSVVITDAMEVAKQRLAEELDGTGVRVPYSIFTKDWPAKVDRKVVDELDTALSNKLTTGETEHMLNLARNLGPLQPHCEQAVRNLIELDQWVAVARWAMDNDCNMPKLANHGIYIEEGRHLLLGVEPDAVTYGLGQCAKKVDRQSLALLTGANSGGKTTLLELLAHTCILAHMGLPVPARNAVVGQVQALHILAKVGGTQSAGALEQTLVELASVVSDPTPKLILADELEAITEPGAGARIIAGMLLAAETQDDTTMMLVTHLAPSIIKATGRTDLRVDGIEATGLDADLELMVDRTPKRNHLARSTPELIVKRLVERSDGHAQELFRDILTMFQ